MTFKGIYGAQNKHFSTLHFYYKLLLSDLCNVRTHADLPENCLWVQTSFRVHWDKQQAERKAKQVFGRVTHKWDANPVLLSAAASPRLLPLNGSVGDSGIQTGLLHKHTDPSSACWIKLFVAVLWWCGLVLVIIRFLFPEENVWGCCQGIFVAA